MTRTRRHTFRPRLDALEDRQLLSAGALDTATFNPPNGFVVTPFTQTSKGTTTTSGQAWAVQVQSDGKIVAAGWAFGDFALARYNSDGTLDTTFGSGGKVLTAFNKSQGARGYDLVIQPDGKILVAGYSDQGTGRGSNDDFAVARYNSNGTLDTTFGPGHNGMLTTDFGGGEQAMSIVLQPDGKVLVGGWTGDSHYSWPTGASKFALARYAANGTLDSTFGSGGKVITDITPDGGDGTTGTDSFAYLGLETVNGTTRIVAAGMTRTADVTGPAGIATALVRYNLDGSLDPSFGSGGVVITNDPLGFAPGNSASGHLVIQSDQKIVVPGQTNESSSVSEMAAARFNLDGTFDTTFNSTGLWPGIATVRNGHALTSVIQPSDGKIVLAGYSTANNDGVNPDTTLGRLNPDGTVDTSFGGGTGYVVQPLSAYGDEALGVALQADGKIVTAGPIQSQTGASNIGFAVARFLNGAPTTTTLASSANPSVYGQSVAFTATFSTTGTVSPTGTVQFLDGSTLLGTGMLSPASATTATATFTTSTLPVGTHSITAVYGGDSNDMGSNSAALSQVVNTTTSTALVTSAVPSAAPMTATAPSFSPSPWLAPLVLDDPGFLTSLVGGKRRRSP
jgi:uncharacterized delta-60 repeat protein